MKGSADVIKVLNEVLRKELTGINQYFIHAKMCKNWGYAVLAEHGWNESIDEMKHADSMIERILFLEGEHRARHRTALGALKKRLPTEPSNQSQQDNNDQPGHSLDPRQRALRVKLRLRSGEAAAFQIVFHVSPERATRPRCSRSIKCAVTDISAAPVSRGSRPLYISGTRPPAVRAPSPSRRTI